jgi:hypothetical protein
MSMASTSLIFNLMSGFIANSSVDLVLKMPLFPNFSNAILSPKASQARRALRVNDAALFFVLKSDAFGAI